MARLADEVVNRIKRDVSLLRLVESQGFKPIKQGKDYAVCCPFHEEKTASCIISPKSNLFHCFGCDAGGSVIDWVMKTNTLSFRAACDYLLKETGTVVDDSVKSSSGAGQKHSEDFIHMGMNDSQALSRVQSYYHQTLLESSEALAYLDKRGLKNDELIKTFKLGFANRSLGKYLPVGERIAGKKIRDQLKGLGILREKTGHEHFAGSLVVPIFDSHGQVVEMYGRKITEGLRAGTPNHLYLPGPHEGVWNAAAFKAHSDAEMILCESLIDAMTFWVNGFRHVTASFGVHGFTDSLLAAFKDHNIKRVLIAYDNDQAGNAAAKTLADKLLKENMECFRVLLPKTMDVNEYACSTTPAAKSLGLALRKAQWMGDVQGRTNIAGGRKPGAMPSITDDLIHAKQVQNVIANSPAHHPGPKSKEEKQECQLDIEELMTDESAKSALEKLDAVASPLAASTDDVEVIDHGHELFMTLGSRIYRVRGFDASAAPSDQMRIQLLVKSEDAEHWHMDKLDLYSAKARQVFVNQACVELGVKDDILKKELGKVLLALETKQSEAEKPSESPLEKDLSDDEKNAALGLLKKKDLLATVLDDFAKAGVVGEETNTLAGYLACVSRKLDKPLAVMIQSSSAAGKSSLMDAILNLMPENERVQYSAMTGQSLFYMGETNLKNKILAISEEEGAHNASYALKLLQSEGEVTIASTGKDDSTGNLVTKEYTVQGPVMLFMTTTAIDIDEELLNRCVVLSVNESREQTQAIHAAQRAKRTLQGLQKKLEKDRIVSLHRNAQRLLRPLAVINPYADQLTFLSDKTRTRRDHEKYLTLIDSIALLHQYQRDIKTIEHEDGSMEYIEVELSDIETANKIAHEILGRTLDELPPQTRKLLKEIQSMVKKECDDEDIEQNTYRFSRKSIREFTGWSDGQLKIHCRRLEELEYLLVHRGGRGQSMEYELLFTGQLEVDQSQLMGLIDTQGLEKRKYDEKKSGQKVEKSAPSQGQVRPKSDPLKSLNGASPLVYSESGQGVAENVVRAV